MAGYSVSIQWKKSGGQAQDEHYSWTFENGLVIQPLQDGDTSSMVDPESAFIASVSSCHMLSLMAIAAKKGYIIQRYEDRAVGALEKNAEGRIAVTRILLQPRISFGGPNIPDMSEVERLHDAAHRNCFIANSVTSTIQIESQRSAI
ncbi:Hypothetical protein HDN1F_31800 [gamma proteobacterium HdN1]|nr:Hypothetical protein HDN1F_31800 [gamma proteobacterium HdN1]